HREAGALEVHRAEAPHVGHLLPDLKQQGFRALDAGALAHPLDLGEEVGRRVRDDGPEGERPAPRGVGGDLRAPRALRVDQVEVGADRLAQRLAVLSADFSRAALQPVVRELVHGVASGHTSGITRSSTETMRSISGRVSTSGGASTMVLPRCRPPPERPTITPRSWQRSTIFLIWGAGMTALEARSTTSSTPAQ